MTHIVGPFHADMRLRRRVPRGKAIFLHIPRTAGSSLGEILRQIYPRERRVRISPHDLDHLEARRADLVRADAICGHVSFGFHELDGIDARYVTFLRHPVDRVVSLYEHQARSPDSENHRLIADGMTLKDLLRSEQSPQFNNHMVRLIAGLPDSEPAYDRHLLERAQGNLDAYFDFVGLTERFEESVALLSKTLGWTSSPSAPPLSVRSARRSATVDDETRAEILRCNALDLDLYGRVVREQHPYATLGPGPPRDPSK